MKKRIFLKNSFIFLFCLILFSGCNQISNSKVFDSEDLRQHVSTILGSQLKNAEITKKHEQMYGFLTLKDDFFRKPLFEQYQLLAPIYDHLHKEQKMDSLVIKSVGNVYEFKVNDNDKKRFNNITNLFYVYGPKKALNREKITEELLKSLEKTTIDKKVIYEGFYDDNGQASLVDLIDEIEAPLIQAERIEQARGMPPRIGMSKEEVLVTTWGKPKDINRTVTQFGSNEQWVYGSGRYIYLDDDVVTAIQD